METQYFLKIRPGECTSLDRDITEEVKVQGLKEVEKNLQNDVDGYFEIYRIITKTIYKRKI